MLIFDFYLSQLFSLKCELNTNCFTQIRKIFNFPFDSDKNFTNAPQFGPLSAPDGINTIISILIMHQILECSILQESIGSITAINKAEVPRVYLNSLKLLMILNFIFSDGYMFVYIICNVYNHKLLYI